MEPNKAPTQRCGHPFSGHPETSGKALESLPPLPAILSRPAAPSLSASSLSLCRALHAADRELPPGANGSEGANVSCTVASHHQASTQHSRPPRSAPNALPSPAPCHFCPHPIAVLEPHQGYPGAQMAPVSSGCEHSAYCSLCLDPALSVNTSLGASSVPGTRKRPSLEESCLCGGDACSLWQE